MKNILGSLFFLFISFTGMAQLQRANTVHKTEAMDAKLPALSNLDLIPPKVLFDTTVKRYGTGNEITDVSTEVSSLESKIKNFSSQKGVLENEIQDAEAKKKELQEEIKEADSVRKDIEKKIRNDSTLLNAEIEKQKILLQQYEAKYSALHEQLTGAENTIALLKNKSEGLTKTLDAIRKEKITNELRLTKIIKANLAELNKWAAQSRADKYLLYKIDSANYTGFLTRLIDTIAVKEKLLSLHKDSLNLKRFPYNNLVVDSETVATAFGYGNLMVENITKIKEQLNYTVKPDIEPLQSAIKALADVSVLFAYPEITYSRLVDSILRPRVKTVNDKIIQLAAKMIDFSASYNSYANDYNLMIAKLNSAFKIKEEEQNNDLSVLGKITSPLNESGLLVPGFDVLAYRKFSDDNVAIFGQAKFILAASKSDTNKLNNGTRIFVPEASTMGFLVDFTFGFDLVEYKPRKAIIPKKYHSLGINASIYYLQKQLNSGDKEKLPFSVGMIQTRVGIEKTIVRNGLAAYINVNGYFMGKGLEQYQQFYDPSTSMQWFVEAGLKSYLRLTKDEKTNISFELRFIPVNPTVRRIVQTKDKFIPLINIGVVRDFAF